MFLVPNKKKKPVRPARDRKVAWIFRHRLIRHKIPTMPAKLSLLLAILLVGCAQTEFDAAPADGEQAVRVGNSQDVPFPGDPLVYRMRADEGHLVFWIDNPTNEPVELLGDKSDVTDPEGIAHHLRGRTI